ncbi:uncharacterized protein LOC144784108 [Lissotriton helveticus]
MSRSALFMNTKDYVPPSKISTHKCHHPGLPMFPLDEENSQQHENGMDKEVAYSTKTIVLFVLTTLTVLFSVVFWIIEETAPAHNTVLPYTPQPPKIPEHSHALWPDSHFNSHSEFSNNTFIQMLHQFNQVSGTTDCYVCGLLPHATQHTVQFLVFPASSAYTCALMNNLTNVFPSRGYAGNLTTFQYFLWTFHAHNNTICNASDSAPMRTIMSTPKRGTWGYTFITIRTKTVAISITSHAGTLCLQGQGKTPVGVSLCNTTMTYDNFTPYLRLPTGLHFVCGNKANMWLPPDWSGTCYIAFLLSPAFNRDNMYHRQKRQLPDVDQADTTGQQFYDAMKGLLLYWGPMSNSLQIRRLTRVLEATINVTAGILTNYSAELDATRMVALQNRMVLDVILAGREGACRIIGTSCCVYIRDSSPSVYDAISKLHRVASEIHQETGTPWSWSSGLWQLLVSWGWKMITVLLISLALLFFCCLCIHCGPALCSIYAVRCTSPNTLQRTKDSKILYQQAVDELMRIDID